MNRKDRNIFCKDSRKYLSAKFSFLNADFTGKPRKSHLCRQTVFMKCIQNSLKIEFHCV